MLGHVASATGLGGPVPGVWGQWGETGHVVFAWTVTRACSGGDGKNVPNTLRGHTGHRGLRRWVP